MKNDLHQMDEDGYPMGYKAAVAEQLRKEDALLPRTLDLFRLRQQGNAYLYFELAFDKATDWMCWLIDRTGGTRKVLVQAQAQSPQEACVPVLQHLERMD